MDGGERQCRRGSVGCGRGGGGALEDPRPDDPPSAIRLLRALEVGDAGARRGVDVEQMEVCIYGVRSGPGW